LLLYLCENSNQVITREQIFDRIWDQNDNYVNDNTLTVYIKRIREKLGIDIIKTIKGIGYRVDK
jgi:DNA-binding response OmpR family regulator